MATWINRIFNLKREMLTEVFDLESNSSSFFNIGVYFKIYLSYLT